MRELQSFNSTHSLSTLGTAIDTLGRAADLHAIAPEDFVTSRRSLMQAWARILQTIEQSYDHLRSKRSTSEGHRLRSLYVSAG